MKIVCVIDSLVAGGAQRQLVALAIGLKEKGHAVVFVTYHDLDFFKKELERHQIAVNLVSSSSYLKRIFKVRKAIRSESPDAVVSFLEVPNFIATLAGFPFRKWKLLVGERSANPEIIKSSKLKMYRYFHSFADYVVANSMANINMVKKINPFLKAGQLKVIYNSIDGSIWKKQTTFQYKQSGVLKLVIPSAHRAVKNLVGLIEAVRLLSQEDREKIKIDWYGMDKGDGSLEKGRALIEQYGLTAVFSFYEATTSIKSVMENADIIGIFSHYEGLPNAICEGMMLGKPVICSSVSDMPQLLNAQQLVDANDYEGIKNKIEWFIHASQLEMEKLGTENHLLAQKLFEKEKIVENYLALLQ